MALEKGRTEHTGDKSGGGAMLGSRAEVKRARDRTRPTVNVMISAVKVVAGPWRVRGASRELSLDDPPGGHQLPTQPDAPVGSCSTAGRSAHEMAGARPGDLVHPALLPLCSPLSSI